MNFELTAVEVRVLGALAEKETTTPDYYPLSLNALVNACNQKSNRDPVLTIDEDTVRGALRSLQEKGLAGPASGAESRVTKYEHRMQEVFNFTRGEAAIICELLLRGPQTPGELRSRAERMFPFTELSDVLTTVQRLMQREPPLVRVLHRQPGTKEARYMHLLSGDTASPVTEPSTPSESTIPGVERVKAIENEVETLKAEIADLKSQFAEFRKQFD